MTTKRAQMKFTVGAAHWRVPSETRAFDGQLEGTPTQRERARRLAEVRRERKIWKPKPEAWDQLQALGEFSGRRVQVEFWDPIMYVLEDEGPCPLVADCRGIAVVRDDEFLQAYLILDGVVELPNNSGYSPVGFLRQRNEIGFPLAPISELFQIELRE
jgi:hypothetical protein